MPVTVRPDPVGFSRASPAAGTGLGTVEISFMHAPQIRITGGVDPEIATAVISFAGNFFRVTFYEPATAAVQSQSSDQPTISASAFDSHQSSHFRPMKGSLGLLRIWLLDSQVFIGDGWRR